MCFLPSLSATLTCLFSLPAEEWPEATFGEVNKFACIIIVCLTCCMQRSEALKQALGSSVPFHASRLPVLFSAEEWPEATFGEVDQFNLIFIVIDVSFMSMCPLCPAHCLQRSGPRQRLVR